MADKEKTRDLAERLSVRLAQDHGLLRVSPAGELFDAGGRLVWHWFKCPKHDSWLQPCWCSGGHEHWHCKVKDCPFAKPAKMRTRIERDLFRMAKYIEEEGK